MGHLLGAGYRDAFLNAACVPAGMDASNSMNNQRKINAPQFEDFANCCRLQ
jgi:hypothetical protein